MQQGGPGTVYWTASVIDAEGRATLKTPGNGLKTLTAFDVNTGRLTAIQTGPTGNGSGVQNLAYTWDVLGNLSLRQDLNAIVGGLTESFTYDALDRLATTSVNNGVAGKTYAYDAMGNFTRKSDVGSGLAGSYHYNAAGAGSVRPHAVTAIDGTVNGVTNPTFAYDANGNLTSGAGRTIAYTSFNLPSSIALGAASLAWSYDSEHARTKEVKNDGSATLYLNPRIDAGIHVERQLTPSGSLDHWENYIYAGGQTVAIQFDYGTGTPKLRYLHKDHLGSTQALSDETGAVPQNPTQAFAYDPWGKRRTLPGGDDPSGIPSALDTASATHHGFTGHEHLNEVGLIHMNGRVYDPLIGRFLTADPTISSVLDSQAFNRYSYLKNNPLRDTDPSGFCGFFSCIAKFIGHVIKTVVQIRHAINPVAKQIDKTIAGNAVLRTLATAAACYWGGPGGCALAAGYTAAVQGLSASQVGFAVLDSLFSTSPILSGFLAEARGRSFLSGFERGLIGLATAAFTYETGVQLNAAGVDQFAAAAITATLGGTLQGAAAAATGGRFEKGFVQGFANGAITASFAYLASQGSWESGGNANASEPEASGDPLSAGPGDQSARATDLYRRFPCQLASIGDEGCGPGGGVSGAASVSGLRQPGFFDRLITSIESWLGSGIRTTRGGSDLIIRNGDGTRQLRFDLNNSHGDAPHINVETFTPRNAYPGDTRMIQQDNIHIYPK